MNTPHQAHIASFKPMKVEDAVERGVWSMEQEIRLLDEMAQQYPELVRQHRSEIRTLVRRLQDVMWRI